MRYRTRPVKTEYVTALIDEEMVYVQHDDKTVEMLTPAIFHEKYVEVRRTKNSGIASRRPKDGAGASYPAEA